MFITYLTSKQIADDIDRQVEQAVDELAERASDKFKSAKVDPRLALALAREDLFAARRRRRLDIGD